MRLNVPRHPNPEGQFRLGNCEHEGNVPHQAKAGGPLTLEQDDIAVDLVNFRSSYRLAF